MLFSKNAAIVAFATSAYAANQVVKVGGNQQLTFSPQTVNAAVGDTVTFQFIDQNHTVTSGAAGQGCTPDGTFNSGFVPVAAAGAANGAATGKAAKGKGKAAKAAGGRNKRSNFIVRGINNVFEGRSVYEERDALAESGGIWARQNGQPTFTVTVKDTNPQPFYCAQLVHCQMGMVGVINPTNNGATSLNTYQQLSAKTQRNQLPNSGAGTGGQLNGAAQAVIGKQAATPPAGPNNQGQTLAGFAALQAANGATTGKTAKGNGKAAKAGAAGKAAGKAGAAGKAAAGKAGAAAQAAAAALGLGGN